MKEQITIKRARAVAYKMLATRARTCKQVSDKLQLKGATEDIICQIIEELLNAGYLNDYEYAQDYIRIQINKKPCGPLYLLAGLQRAGINRGVAREIIEQMVPTEKEYELAASMLEKLLKRDEKCPKRAMRMLLNRGFTHHVAHKAVDEEFCPHLDIMP